MTDNKKPLIVISEVVSEAEAQRAKAKLESFGQPILVSWTPPKTPLEKLRYWMRSRLSSARVWIYFRWCEIQMALSPTCSVHPHKRLYKGWCAACDVDAFIREQRLRNLRGE